MKFKKDNKKDVKNSFSFRSNAKPFREDKKSKSWDDKTKKKAEVQDKSRTGTGVRFKPERELFVWGKRTVEGFLTTLHSQEGVDVSKYALHIIVDKSNKAPAQLKPIVESAKTLGIKILSHQNAEDTWPLADSVTLNHQRICLKIPEYPVSDIEDVLAKIKENGENNQNGCVGLVLDQIQDPRNFGAILRSAAFFGVKFVVYATDRQADITGLVLKTSAGGAFSLMLAPVVNINRALEKLKDSGAWIVGSTLQEGSLEMSKLPKDRQWVLVLGNEEKGLRAEVVKKCDYLVKIPGGDTLVDSLNVSVAAGVLIHGLINL